MLGTGYGKEIDMWSFGCMMIELYTGYPIFPGESEKEQLALIMSVLGYPPKEMMSKAKRWDLFFDKKGNEYVAKEVINSRGRKRVPN